jgi:hypothetical protein
MPPMTLAAIGPAWMFRDWSALVLVMLVVGYGLVVVAAEEPVGCEGAADSPGASKRYSARAYMSHEYFYLPTLEQW